MRALNVCCLTINCGCRGDIHASTNIDITDIDLVNYAGEL